MKIQEWLKQAYMYIHPDGGIDEQSHGTQIQLHAPAAVCCTLE